MTLSPPHIINPTANYRVLKELKLVQPMKKGHWGPLESLTDLFLNVGGLLWCRPGKNPGVGEAGLQQGDNHKHNQHASNHRDATGQVLHQEGTAANTGERERENMAAVPECWVTRTLDCSISSSYVI